MDAEVKAVFDAAKDLTATQQAQLVRSLPDPSQSVAGTLWLMIVGALIVVLIGGVGLLYLLTNNGKPTDVILPIVTSSLTALVGLLAPSPVAGGGN